MNTEILLIPLAASICLFIALIQAWIMTMIRYFDVPMLKRTFPNFRDLVRSHVDYLMMAGLILSLYLAAETLDIILPKFVVWLIFVGALYNPFGFFIQAIKPNIVQKGGLTAKVGVALGFIPLSIGLFWISIELSLAALKTY